MERDAALGALFAVLVCIFKTLVLIFTPLYLDSLNPMTAEIHNISNHSDVSGNSSFDIIPIHPSTPAWQRIDPFFGVWLSMGFDTLLFGTIVLVMYLCVPGQISDRETNYPKAGLFFSGSFQTVSALLYQFSTSGTRTPPYLQAALGYFLIPSVFILRFFILRKKPTRRKLVCALIIVGGEIVCLLPAMIPNMESQAARRTEGGATGVGRIIWPIIYVFQKVPHALWNILLEKGAKAKAGKENDATDVTRLNMAYVMFWNFFGTFSTALLIFWIDLIPGFGLMPDIKLFFPLFWFNLKCIFGSTDVCGFHQVFVAWGRIISKTSLFVTAGLLVRYGEGASLYGIIGAIVTPLQFIVFALFDEPTSKWHPHATLSTWLSIGALVVMVPTVILYNTGSPEITVPRRSSSSASIEAEADHIVTAETDPLLQSTGQYGSINAEHCDT